MLVQWNDFNEFRYVECGDEFSLYTEVKNNLDVVFPGGKAREVNKGDFILVDKAGTEVFVLEKAKPVAKVKEAVKETLIEKVKNVTKKEKTKKAKRRILGDPKVKFDIDKELQRIADEQAITSTED